MMLPILQIGPLSLQTPGLILLLSIWVGLSLSEKNSEKYGIDSNVLYRITMLALVGGIIGARLAYIARYPGAFSGNLLSIFSLSPDMLDVSGGLLTGILAGLIYIQKRNLNFWKVVDSMTPGIAVVSVGMGLMNLASGGGYGAPSNIPWSIELWGESRHPSQIYHVILAGLVAWAIWPVKYRLLRWKSMEYQPGVTFLLFVVLISVAGIILESFRGDSATIFSVVRLEQVVYWMILGVALHFLDKKQINQQDQ